MKGGRAPNSDRWLGLRLPLGLGVAAVPLALGALSAGLVYPAPARADAVAPVSEFSIPTADSEPTGITAGPDGNVWFTESGGDKIGRITSAGEMTEFPIPTADSEPAGISAGPDNDIWFTERRGDKLGRITPGGEINEFPLGAGSEPTSITNGRPGYVAFTAPGRNTYYEMASSGEVCAGSGSPGDEPLGIATGPEGNIWGTDIGTNRIDKTEHNASCTGGGALFNHIPTANSRPVGLTAGPDNAMWFTEEAADQIGRLDIPQRAFTELPIPTANARPAGITTFGSEVWFVEKGGDKVGRLSPTGRFNEYAIPTDGGEPTDIAPGPDGRLWFTESGTGKIGRLTPPPLPKNTTAPTVSGKAEQGQTLTAEPGAWNNDPTGYNYQWERCAERPNTSGGGARLVCAPILGAVGQHYVAGVADVGLELRVAVEANSPAGIADPAQSAVTRRVIALLGMRARANLAPDRRPRTRKRDGTLRIGFRSFQVASSSIPSLDSIDFEISRSVTLSTTGLPSCRPQTFFSDYGGSCRRSLVGEGEVSAEITLRGRQPVMVRGPMDAYYSFAEGEPRILAVVHGENALPLTYVIPFLIRKGQRGLGTELVARQMRRVLGICVRQGCGSPYTISGVYTHIASFELALHRRFKSHGRWRSLIRAACPARTPEHQLTFPLARTQLRYSQGTVRKRLVRDDCHVAGA